MKMITITPPAAAPAIAATGTPFLLLPNGFDTSVVDPPPAAPVDVDDGNPPNEYVPVPVG